MTDNLPNYAITEPPDWKPVEEYTTHERRGEILQDIVEAGSPFAIKQCRLAERYDVHESTISRDMDRIRESCAEHLGGDAKLLTRALLQKTVRELHREGEWKAAWDVVMDWNDWLAEVGEQHREPDRSEVDVEMESRNVDVAYTIVRGGDDEDPLPSDEEGQVDHEALGFTSAPTSIDVEAPGGDGE